MALDLTERSGLRRPRGGIFARRKRARVWIVVAIGLGFIALAWAWAFQRAPGDAGSGVPVLTADHHPTRVRPTKPGGLKVPDIDPLAYDSGRVPPKIENILPGPARPLPQPVPPPKPAPPASPETSTIAAAPASVTVTPTPVGDTPAASRGYEAASVSLGGLAPPPRKPPPPNQAAAKPKMMAAIPSVPPVKPAHKPKPVSAPPAAKTKVRPLVDARGGGYRVQLASLHSAADAMKVGQRLRHRYGDVLHRYAFSYVPVDLGGRGVYYRIMAGPMSHDTAAQTCAALKRRGAACLVTKP